MMMMMMRVVLNAIYALARLYVGATCARNSDAENVIYMYVDAILVGMY